MKRWQQMLIAWLLFIFYLLAGAFLFQAIELPQEKQAAERFFKSMNAFLESHPCVSRDEFYKYSIEVVDAVDRGVFDLEYGTGVESQMAGQRRTVWDLPNSFFFSATIVTTIGYGDLTPQTSLGRISCMIYGAVGLPLTGWVIGVIARSLTAYWAKALDRTNSFLLVCVRFARLRKAVMILITLVLLYAVLLQVPAVVLMYIEQWDILSAVYYCFITLTTIGFGDLVVGNHPDFSQAAKWILKTCMVLYVMLGLSLLVALSSAVVERANKTVRKTLMTSGNRYEVSSRSEKQRRRSRASEMLGNEIALTYIPDLSSARASSDSFLHLDKMPKDTKAEWIELQTRTLPIQSEDVPPGYDEVIIDVSVSADSSCVKASNGVPKSTRSLPHGDLSVHRTSLGNGNTIETNGSISIISADNYGDERSDNPPINRR